jgi:hypothetical protein
LPTFLGRPSNLQVLVTYSLPSRVPHHSAFRLLTGHAAGSKLTIVSGSRNPGCCNAGVFHLRIVCVRTMDANHADPFYHPSKTVDEVVETLSRFTVDQRSLAWSPEPPFESVGAHDCRIGGNCGLDFSRGTARARWIQARHRWNREERTLQRQSRLRSGERLPP